MPDLWCTVFGPGNFGQEAKDGEENLSQAVSCRALAFFPCLQRLPFQQPLVEGTGEDDRGGRYIHAGDGVQDKGRG